MRSKTELRDNFSSDPHSTQRILATSAAGGGITGRQHPDYGPGAAIGLRLGHWDWWRAHPARAGRDRASGSGTGTGGRAHRQGRDGIGAPASALGLVASTPARAGRDRAPARALDWWRAHRQGRTGSGLRLGHWDWWRAHRQGRDGIGLRLGHWTWWRAHRQGRDGIGLRLLRHCDLVAEQPHRKGGTGTGLRPRGTWGLRVAHNTPTVTSGMLRKYRNSDECPSCVTS